MSYPTGASRTNEGAVDLRSDTVTRPDAAMRAAMAAAEVGDDVFRDDPTVARLEDAVAERFGKEAAIFLPTGTQSNLVAMLVHCGRGDEILVGRGYHVECAEARGTSVLGGIALDPLPLREDAGIDAEVVTAAIKPKDPHCPVSRVLSLENTVGGRVVRLGVQDAAVEAGRAGGLATHLDGARVFNAAVALGEGVDRVARGFDTVSVCLSKGLGTPAGSVLCGDAGRMAAARRWRKMLGGGMRQSGVLAAAGLHALEHEVVKLPDDHRRAAELRAALAEMPGFEVSGDTNMVWLHWTRHDAGAMAAQYGGTRRGDHSGAAEPCGWCCHHDVDDAGLARVIEAFRSFAEGAVAA